MLKDLKGRRAALDENIKKDLPFQLDRKLSQQEDRR